LTQVFTDLQHEYGQSFSIMNSPAESGLDFYVAHESIKATILTSLLTVWVLIGVFVYLNRYTNRRYFTVWTTAWMFYVVWLTLNLGDLAAGRNSLRVMTEQWCLATAAVFLMWGSFRFLALRVRETAIGLFMAFLFIWSFIGVYQLGRPFAARATLFAFIGLAGIGTGVAFARHRCHRGYIGASMLALGFFLWGLYFMAYPFVEEHRDLLATGFFISAVLQLFIAVSMIILVLEEVRSTNQNALNLLRSEKLKASQLKIAATSSEHQFRNLFDHAGEAIIITAAGDLRILDLNERAVRFLGIKRGEAREQFLPSFCPTAEPAAPARNDSVEWVNRLCAQRTLSVIKKNGEATLSEVESSRIEFQGQPAFQFLFREVTDRTRLEEQLRQAEKLSSLGQMISGVAHELNNPLSVIKGYLDLIVAHHEIPGQTRSDLGKVIQESNRAIKLVRDFLSFSRGQPARRETVDVNTFIQRVAELRRPDLASASVELFLDLGSSLPPVSADPDQVQQLVINLLNNAIQAMAATPEPRTLRITTGLKTPETLLLAIEDSGPGVPPGLESRIFEPFFTTKPTGSGTGLGLSIAHSIMAEHHGRVYYTTSTLGGAGFNLEFPVVVDATETPVPEIVPVMELPPPGRRSQVSARVLVLDDEQFIAELLAEMLGVLGHKAVVCFTAAEALAQAESSDFDLVISDFRMPVMNGEQFYRELARIKPELADRTIFLTGDVVNEETQDFLASTGNPHLDKPFQLTRLEAVIGGVLSAKAALVAA
jgi:two-component system NtrC family sensor kinase